MRKSIINRELVRAVKRHLKNQWHDASWFEFNFRDEVQAVIFAIEHEQLKTDTDIIEEATKYLAAQG